MHIKIRRYPNICEIHHVSNYYTNSHMSRMSESPITILIPHRLTPTHTGRQVQNNNETLHTLASSDSVGNVTQVTHLSLLYESAPAYIEDQPRFLNAAFAARTELSPRELLKELKAVEVPFSLSYERPKHHPTSLNSTLLSLPPPSLPIFTTLYHPVPQNSHPECMLQQPLPPLQELEKA